MARLNDRYEEKRNELILIALRLFVEKGYEATTINNILQTAGISKGAMYHYFDSKDNILEAVLDYLVESDRKSFASIINNNNISSIDKLESLLLGTREKTEEVELALQLSKRAEPSIFDYRAKEMSMKKTIPDVAKIIEQGIKEGMFNTDNPNEIAEVVYLLIVSLSEKTALERESFTPIFIDLLENCLGAKKGTLEKINSAILNKNV